MSELFQWDFTKYLIGYGARFDQVKVWVDEHIAGRHEVMPSGGGFYGYVFLDCFEEAMLVIANFPQHDWQLTNLN